MDTTTTTTSLDEHNFKKISTSQKRKSSESTKSSSCQLVSKVFRSESKSLPFGIANVLQSSPLKSSSSSSSPPTSSSSTSSINPWIGALQQITPPASSTNASNWCAKCSIQFRLTSELVHHIRLHHANRRQPSFHQQVPSATPTVMKHSSILTCQICYETFRERHHLTRHMTSHR